MSVSINKDVFNFLDQLKSNNDRDWFNAHKSEFQSIQKEVKAFYSAINDGLNTHDEIDKFKMFRIYRDVRFSKNKQPYKTHFGGSFHRKKPELRGGYYLHLEPDNKSFVAVGFWEPHKDDLLRIRKEIELDDQEFRDVTNAPSFKSVWGELEGDTLKTAPKGFDKEHKAIDLLRFKQYIFTKTFSDKEVLDANFIIEVNKAFAAVRPYFDYMSSVLTTNLNGESLI
ncbi:MAG: TIGR02453 family protein [Bacteroidetes bacterium MedPE-SWsnd-G2]|nr:MAG: TIGR02453 family protein [Bacteroidetes bacterium MedPE-SWsnd-G2]